MRYIGSTTNKVKLRILQHWRAIKNRDFIYVTSKHAWECHKGDLGKMTYFGIKHIPKQIRGGDRELILRRTESRLIMEAGTEIPFGLNTDSELHVYL